MAAASLSLAVAACSTDAPGSAGGDSGAAGDGGVGEGVSERPSEPFQPSDEVGEKPDLPKKAAAAMNVVSAELFANFSKAMKNAATNSGLDFVETAADGDPAKNIEQLNSILNQGVGATFVWDVDVESQRPVVKQMMDTGMGVFTLSSGPSTMPIVANQVALGVQQVEAAKDFITNELDGKAKVVLFNLDNLANIKPRYDEIRKQLAELPGVEIVNDVTWDSADPDFGFTTMNSILQKQPDINVIIGEDPVVVSARKATEAAGVDMSKMLFIGGGGDTEALSYVKQGGTSPRQLSFAYNFSIIGYGAGIWAADWVNGKQIPALTVVKGVPLDSLEAIEAYEADVADPQAAFENKLDTYVDLFGNISYETRDQYWNSTNPQ